MSLRVDSIPLLGVESWGYPPVKKKTNRTRDTVVLPTPSVRTKVGNGLWTLEKVGEVRSPTCSSAVIMQKWDVRRTATRFLVSRSFKV